MIFGYETFLFGLLLIVYVITDVLVFTNMDFDKLENLFFDAPFQSLIKWQCLLIGGLGLLVLGALVCAMMG